MLPTFAKNIKAIFNMIWDTAERKGIYLKK